MGGLGANGCRVEWLGMIGCRDALPDIADLAEDFTVELDELYAATVG